jgi:hypothetical protein
MRMLFGWPLISDSATLSGGGWESALPVTNMQDAMLARAARSLDESDVNTQWVTDFGTPRHVGVVALCRHNLSADAQWRVEGSTVSDFASVVYDSGWLDAWPAQWEVGVLPVGHPNAATRRLTNADIAALDPPRDVVLPLTTDVQARYWRIRIDDESNPAGYVQIGRAVLAPTYRPSLNFSVGAEVGFNDDTAVGTSRSGVRLYEVRPKGRTFGFQIANIREPEALTVARDMMEMLGRAGQFYIVPAPAEVTNLQRRSFLATFRQLSPITIAAAGYASVPFVVDEVL